MPPSRKPKQVRQHWAKNLRDARLRRQLSQEQLSRLTGIGQQNISRWERAITVPRDETKFRLAKFFGVPVTDLFPWDDNNGSAAA